MSKYDIDCKRLIKQVLPFSLRKSLIEFIYVIIKPIRDLFFRFSEAKKEDEAKLSYNAQYPNLQRLLNDKFDAENRKIRIFDSLESINELLVFPNNELKPIHLGQTNIYPSSRWSFEPFTVLLPSELGDNEIENKVKRFLNIYKFSGTKYNIVYE